MALCFWYKTLTQTSLEEGKGLSIWFPGYGLLSSEAEAGPEDHEGTLFTGFPGWLHLPREVTAHRLSLSISNQENAQTCPQASLVKVYLQMNFLLFPGESG